VSVLDNLQMWLEWQNVYSKVAPVIRDGAKGEQLHWHRILPLFLFIQYDSD